MNLSLTLEKKKYKTHFIYLKDKNVNYLEELNNLNISINDNNIILTTLEKLENTNNSIIGKINNNQKCDLCKIKNKKKIKELSCGHNFHYSCINNKFKYDLYKKCIICNTENITQTLL